MLARSLAACLLLSPAILSPAAAFPGASTRAHKVHKPTAPVAPEAPQVDDSAKPAEDTPSPDAWQIIDWVIASHDNNGMPFIVVDKVAAHVFAYDSSGQFVAAAPALVGITRGR